MHPTIIVFVILERFAMNKNQKTHPCYTNIHTPCVGFHAQYTFWFDCYSTSCAYCTCFTYHFPSNIKQGWGGGGEDQRAIILRFHVYHGYLIWPALEHRIGTIS